MKKFLSAVFAVFFLAACDRHEHAAHIETTADTNVAPPMHEDGEGILLCEATKDSIALKKADATEREESGEAVLVVPKSAVLETTAGASVYVANGEHYKRSNVKVGRAFGDVVEITEGVCEGDEVVTGAAQTLWLIELRAVKGGKGCCPMPDAKGKPEKAGHGHAH